MRLLDELKRLTQPYDEEDEDYEEFEPALKPDRKRDRADREETAPAAGFDVQTGRRSNKVVNIHTTTQLQVVLIKPERFDSATEIADHLREKHTVVLNLEQAGSDVARRLIDFASGVAYASSGKIQKVAAHTFIITPFNVDILGDLVGELENNGLYL